MRGLRSQGAASSPRPAARSRGVVIATTSAGTPMIDDTRKNAATPQTTLVHTSATRTRSAAAQASGVVRFATEATQCAQSAPSSSCGRAEGARGETHRAPARTTGPEAVRRVGIDDAQSRRRHPDADRDLRSFLCAIGLTACRKAGSGEPGRAARLTFPGEHGDDRGRAEHEQQGDAGQPDRAEIVLPGCECATGRLSDSHRDDDRDEHDREIGGADHCNQPSRKRRAVLPVVRAPPGEALLGISRHFGSPPVRASR